MFSLKYRIGSDTDASNQLDHVAGAKYFRLARLTFHRHFSEIYIVCYCFPSDVMFNPYLPSSPASSSTSALPHSGPITRSRTLFYLSIRDSSITGYGRRKSRPVRGKREYGDTVDVAEDEEQGLIGGKEGGLSVKGLPPKWWVDACL